MKHVEETEQSTGSESEQPQPVEPVTSSACETVSTVHSNSSHTAATAVDPKYVQLLGDKAAVSMNLLIFPISKILHLFADNLMYLFCVYLNMVLDLFLLNCCRSNAFRFSKLAVCCLLLPSW